MPTPSNYGTNYSVWLGQDGLARAKSRTPSYDDPFPNPMNDGQRVENARARAAAAGEAIGSGRINPQSGVLEDPNDEPWYLDPRIIGPLAVGAAGGVGALASGPAAAGVIPGTGIPTVAGAGGTAALPTAPAVTAGTIAGTTAAGTSAIDKIRNSLTSANGIASLASLIPALVSATSGGGNTGNADLSRLNAITEARMRRADPLHQVAVQLAYGRAPIRARNGISLQNVPLPE